MDQLWDIGSKLNDEDAVVAKVNVLANTQRYKLAKYAGQSGRPYLRTWKAKTIAWRVTMDDLVGLIGRDELVSAW